MTEYNQRREIMIKSCNESKCLVTDHFEPLQVVPRNIVVLFPVTLVVPGCSHPAAIN